MGAPLQQDSPAAAPGSLPCISLNILTPLENAEMVQSLATAYTAKPRTVDRRNVTPAVTQEESGTAVGKVASFPPLRRGRAG